jgi:hypothetical protein
MSERIWIRTCALGAVALAAAFLTACGGGSAANPAAPAAPGVAISGTVAAPGGSVQTAFMPSGALPRAESAAGGSASGVSPLGAGITVNLIQIDATGSQVGPVIASGVTDTNGNYTLTAPAGFTPSPSYVVKSATSTPMLAFVTSTTANIDPYTLTTVTLVTGTLHAAGVGLAAVDSADIAAVHETVLVSSGNVTLTLGTTAAQMASALAASVQNDQESSNTVASLAAQGGIAGAVQDANGQPVAGAQILVRTYGNQVTTATTRTDANGAYTLRVPAGSYIVGALNDTTTSTAASAWWTGGGGATSQFKAAKVTVAAATVTCNFALAAGGRLAGTVTASDTGLPLAGITVALNDFTSGQTDMFVKTLPDGTVTCNVAPGSYYVSLRNSTLQPYATGCIANGLTGGGKNSSQAERITVTAGSSQQGAMALVPGHLLQGVVSDPVTGPVAGVVVRFQDFDAQGVGCESVRTGVDGTYSMWVQPGHYNVLTRGQQAVNLDCTTGGQTQNFTAAVGQITATLQDPQGNPVGQAYVYVYDNTGTTPTDTMLSFEVANSDGTVTVYTTAPTSSVKLGFLIDSGAMVGSTVYGGAGGGVLEAISAGTAVAAPAAGATTALGTVGLPAGAVLSGSVNSLANGNAGAANKMVSIRIGGQKGGAKMVNVRTRSDGSYGISLPAGATLTAVVAYDANAPANWSITNGTSMVPGLYDLTSNLLMGATGSTTQQVLAY